MKHRALPQPSPAAVEFFGSALPQIQTYGAMLAAAGVERGLIGPREVPRLWERHLLNSAVLAAWVGPGEQVCDLGSGAGLPGLVLAIQRPDVSVVLLEPLLRRATFLQEVVDALELPHVEVVRARAEEAAGRAPVDVVTARAVAPLERLAGWAIPLLRPGGRLLALKGESADQEVASASAALERAGVVEREVIPVSAGGSATVLVRVTLAGAARQQVRP